MVVVVVVFLFDQALDHHISDYFQLFLERRVCVCVCFLKFEVMMMTILLGDLRMDGDCICILVYLL